MSDRRVPSLQGAGLRGVILPCGCGCQTLASPEPMIVAEAAAGVSDHVHAVDAEVQPHRTEATSGEGAEAGALPSLVPI